MSFTIKAVNELAHCRSKLEKIFLNDPSKSCSQASFKLKQAITSQILASTLIQKKSSQDIISRRADSSSWCKYSNEPSRPIRHLVTILNGIG